MFKEKNTKIEFLSGLLSGFTSSSITYPLDLCKTRINIISGQNNK